MKLLLAALAALPHVTCRATEAAARHGMAVVETTTLPNGHIIDWVLQDEVAPPSEGGDVLDSLVAPLHGPKGTVPYLRNQPSPGAVDKQPPAHGTDGKRRADIPLGHKYALAGQSVSNLGCGARFSLYDPYLERTDDFSLIQTAVSNTNVQNTHWGPIVQTVEAGWQKYPAYSTPPGVHFFTFFNANGYKGIGDNAAGYNTDVKGWVQVDSTVYPGYQFRPLSVDGGEQHDIDLQYRLIDQKWWLSVGGRYIGYYPAWLFAQNITTGASLATAADKITFYGEVYSSNTQTTTDMGSGEFPSAGPNKSAYIRNMVYASPSNVVYNFDANLANIVTDPNDYNLETHYNSGAPWDSYILLGGPGAGGNVGS